MLRSCRAMVPCRSQAHRCLLDQDRQPLSLAWRWCCWFCRCRCVGSRPGAGEIVSALSSLYPLSLSLSLSLARSRFTLSFSSPSTSLSPSFSLSLSHCASFALSLSPSLSLSLSSFPLAVFVSLPHFSLPHSLPPFLPPYLPPSLSPFHLPSLYPLLPCSLLPPSFFLPSLCERSLSLTPCAIICSLVCM